MPVHGHLLVDKGIYLLEVMNLEELARERIYEFVFITLPLKLKGATGSPVRPVALASDRPGNDRRDAWRIPGCHPLSMPAPIVVDVSRSGREYPHEFRSGASFTDVHDNASMYVESWGAAPGVGATMLYACFPNTFIDVNREDVDLDPTLIDGDWPKPLKPSPFSERGLGLLKKVTRYGEPMHERKLTVAEVQDRLHRSTNLITRNLRRSSARHWLVLAACGI